MDTKLVTNSIIHCQERQLGTIDHLSKIEKEQKLINVLPTDVYYHGDPERNKEIIEALEKRGGNNKYAGFCAGNSKLLYYISKDHNYIKCCNPEKDKELTSFIVRFYKMLTLPSIKTIEIEGKKYRKEDVLKKLKNLKTY